MISKIYIPCFMLLCLMSLTGCPVEADEPVVPSPKVDMSGTDMSQKDMSSKDMADMGQDVDMKQAGFSLLSAEPALGPQSGGTQVLIKGTAFNANAMVFFGETPATTIDVRSPTQLMAVSPAGMGTVDIKVTQDQETAILPQVFQYTEDNFKLFCQLQAQSPVSALVGENVTDLYAVVFATDITPGDGQGAGLEAEIGYGTGDDPSAFQFGAMTYNVDKPGPNMEKANDEYGGTFSVDTAGAYKYAARVRVPGVGNLWTYCDLDGSDNGTTPDQLGQLTITEAPVPTIEFCKVETPSTSVLTMMQTPDINALVFVKGVTDAQGEGANIKGRITWGDINVDPAQWTNTADAAYVEDADGLVAGDLANDRYRANLTPSMAGEFGYLYSFSADGGQSWTLCDTRDVVTPQMIDTQFVGKLTVNDVNLPDECTLQFPHVVTQQQVGQPLTVFGRVLEQGVTDVSDDAATIKGRLWVGQADADPVAMTGFVDSYPATFKGAFAQDTNQDEYEATFTPMTAGTYRFLFQFSADSGTTFLPCDFDGSTSNASFDKDATGHLNVVQTVEDAPDYCHIFQANVVQSLADPNVPIFTMEIYEAGITDQQDGGASAGKLEVEVATGTLWHNPAASVSYTWLPMPYARTVGNNYEFEISPPYMMPPAIGLYNVVSRVRKTGDTQWIYCDAFDQSMDFLIDRAARLEITQ